MNNKLTKTLLASAAMALFGAVASIQAATPMAPGDVLTTFSPLGSLYSGYSVVGAQQNVPVTGFSTVDVNNNITGLYLASAVITGDASVNPGGLTFLFAAGNTFDSSSNLGITSLILSGFAGQAVSVDFYNYSPFSVPPDFIERSDSTDNGNQLLLGFTAGDPIGPPIFAGQFSWVLAVYTNATDFVTSAPETFGVTAFASTSGAGHPLPGVAGDEVTAGSFGYAPKPVPDSGSTGALLGLGVLSCAAAGLKRKK